MSKQVAAFVAGCSVIVLLGMILVAARYASNIDPTVVIPSPAMPSPNAFDYFLRAGHELVDKDKVGNALSTYDPTQPASATNQSLTLAEKEALVAENQPALTAMRAGFAYPYVNPMVRSFSTLLPYYATDRAMCRVLRLEDDVDAANGRWNDAITADLDAVQMGEMVPHGSLLIGSLVGAACEAIGRRGAWVGIDHLSASEARAAARRLTAITAAHMPTTESLQEEKWCNEAGLIEIFHKPNWRLALAETCAGGADDTEEATKLDEQLQFMSKKSVLDDYIEGIDGTIASSRIPYPDHPVDPPLPANPIAAAMIPVSTAARFKEVYTLAQDRLLAVSLALRAYKLEHAIYPSTLTALVPSYLDAVPDDPFNISEPLKYRLTSTGYVLYSIGPDGNDDGGRPIFDPSQQTPGPGQTDRRHMAMANSVGDIVAGVNGP